MSKISNAIDIIHNALTAYCEDSIGSDKREQRRTDKAWKTITDALPKPAPKPKPACQHLTGYWINYRVNFRCYGCQCQFDIRELRPTSKRRIETWTAS